MPKAIVSYAVRKCTDPEDIRIAIDKLDEVTLSISKKQEGVNDYIEMLLIRKYLDVYVKMRNIYRKNKSTI